MTLTRDNITDRQASDVGAYINNLSGVLVTANHGNLNGLLSPVIPVVDVHVSTAYRRLVNLDEHLVTGNLRNRNIFEPKAFFRVFFY